ncbi:MAG: RagB/SusD family nutrient uptake outer membrane protein [Ferruginibacter sp.]
MAYNKKINHGTCFLFLMIILLCSCTKLADKDYTEIVSDQFTPGASDLVSLVGPAYGAWRNVLGYDGSSGLFRTEEVTADEVVIPARPNGWVDDGSYRRLHEHKWSNTDGTAQNWSTAYSGITNCNRLIFQIESGKLPVPTGKDNVLAEIRALRASYYYVLCDLYGNVPIVTKFDVEPGFLAEQNTRQQVYDFIVKELTDAMPLLSDDATQLYYGRFNKWAAYSVLAKMYLNAEVYTGTAQWAKCIEACDAIISSNKYSLSATQRSIFVADNSSNKEIIFAVPYDPIYAPGFNLHMETLQPENQATYNLQSSAWGGIAAVPQYIDTYDPQDLRLKDNWIKGQQYTAAGAPINATLSAFNGKPLIFINAIPGVDSSQEVHGYRLGKFEFALGSTTNLSNDVPLFRLSDIIMMKAESLLRTNKADDAAVLVTAVRARSFVDNPAKAPVTGAQLQAGSSYDYGRRDHLVTTHEGGADIKYGRLLDELGWEFNQEPHRRQDMLRWGIFTKKSWFSHQPNGDYRNLMPIPAGVLATNPKLKQNPGY